MAPVGGAGARRRPPGVRCAQSCWSRYLRPQMPALPGFRMPLGSRASLSRSLNRGWALSPGRFRRPGRPRHCGRDTPRNPPQPPRRSARPRGAECHRAAAVRLGVQQQRDVVHLPQTDDELRGVVLRKGVGTLLHHPACRSASVAVGRRDREKPMCAPSGIQSRSFTSSTGGMPVLILCRSCSMCAPRSLSASGRVLSGEELRLLGFAERVLDHAADTARRPAAGRDGPVEVPVAECRARPSSARWPRPGAARRRCTTRSAARPTPASRTMLRSTGTFCSGAMLIRSGSMTSTTCSRSLLLVERDQEGRRGRRAAHELDAHLRDDAEVRLREQPIRRTARSRSRNSCQCCCPAAPPMPVRTTSPSGSTTSSPAATSEVVAVRRVADAAVERVADHAAPARSGRVQHQVGRACRYVVEIEVA